MVALLYLVAAGPAAAHNPVPGIEGFYTGLRHPFTTPDQVLALLGIGLLLGSFALSRLLPAFAALGLGLLGGFAVGRGGGGSAAWLYGLAATTASAAALVPDRWRTMLVAAAGAGGFLLAQASVPEAGPAQDRIVTMAGSLAAVVLVTLYLAGTLDLLRARIRPPVLDIGMRVAAAWVAAIAILMLALSLSRPVG